MKLTLLLATCLLAPRAFADTYEYQRSYQPGDRYQYILTTEVLQNGKPRSFYVGETEHLVSVSPAGGPTEQIRWLSSSLNGQKLDARDLTVPNYEMSLSPRAPLIAPDLKTLLRAVPGAMVGMVTDLLTYYAAINPNAGIRSVRQVGDLWKSPAPLKGEWSDKDGLTAGEDCITPVTEMIELTDQIAWYRTSYLAPETPCLRLRKEWMLAPVDGSVPNNMQQVSRADVLSRWMVLWGHEQFIIDTWVERSSGKILKASMNNTLTLKMKVECDEQLESCAAEFPYTLQRNEVLSLR